VIQDASAPRRCPYFLFSFRPCVILNAAKNPGLSECWQMHSNHSPTEVFGSHTAITSNAPWLGCVGKRRKRSGILRCAQNDTKSERQRTGSGSDDDAQHLVFYEDELLWRLAVEVTLDGLAVEDERAHLIFRGAGRDLQAVADFAAYLHYYCDHFVEYEFRVELWPGFQVD
jgi:hypothetical protein